MQTQHLIRPRRRQLHSALIRPHSIVLSVALVVLSAHGPNALAASATAPTIRLFPTTVLEDIRQTGTVAAEMETGLQDAISRMDQQKQLFEDAKCDGAKGDPGCARIAKQLGATYLEMLTIMGERLPDMERAVNNTHASLEQRLRSELGRKMTPWTLQETLLGNGATESAASTPALRGGSGMRLSERFRQYYKLVANPAGQDNGHSLAVVASDIYLDMAQASQLIARTQEEISRATLMEQLNQSFGIITPEMEKVVGGVKSILFGDMSVESQVAGPPPGSMPTEYKSPLEL